MFAINIGEAAYSFRQWVKNQEHPLAALIYGIAKAIQNAQLPDMKILFGLILRLHELLSGVSKWLARVFYWTPLFKSKISNAQKNLYLYGGLPLITGHPEISIGDDCRVSGCTTFSARSAARQRPVLEIGNNVDIGWQTTIAIGSKVKLGNNVRIAGRALLAGYPGHPLNTEDRAAGLPECDDQVGDIILEDDVWLATNVSIISGVTIGRGTVVAAGSVVTKDLPAGVIAAGVPAKVIRRLEA